MLNILISYIYISELCNFLTKFVEHLQYFDGYLHLFTTMASYFHFIKEWFKEFDVCGAYEV